MPSRHVLLVDGDAETRMASARTLERLGCDVLAVGSGAEAERVLQAGIALDALVVDVAEARVDGRSVAGDAVRRWPHARLVFTARALPALVPDAGRAPVLVTPLTAHQLAHALGEGQPR